MKIGILGAESKHTDYFASLLNGRRLFPDMEAVALWGGDCPQRIAHCTEVGAIPAVYGTPEEVIARSDGILITTRRGDSHRQLAVKCLQAGKPVFVDKPFSCTPEDALAMVEASQRTGTPLMGGSTLCFLPQVEEFRERARYCSNVKLSYAADCDSPFGGWSFYGSHLTDLCSVICGMDAMSVHAVRTGSAAEIEICYPERHVTLYTRPDLEEPEVVFSSWGEERCRLPDFNRCYEYGMRAFADMMRSGLSRGTSRLLFSTRLLAAVEQSLRSQEKISFVA